MPIHPRVLELLANHSKPKRYECHFAGENNLTLTGFIDDPAWDLAPWTDDFVDIEGDLRQQPRFRTRAKLLWNPNYLYIAAEMEEPHLWATLTEHDSVIFQDHDFEVFIDPDGDALRYFEYEINALNTDWDLFLDRPYRDKGSADNGWESHALHHVGLMGTINNPHDIDQGWRVEIAFPWNCFEAGAVHLPPIAGDSWRINFSRVEWPITIADGHYVKPPGATEDNWVWSPQGVVDMHQPEMWGIVTFTS